MGNTATSKGFDSEVATDASGAQGGNQEIDIAQLMSRIREGAERRKANSVVDASAALYRLLRSDKSSGVFENGASAPGARATPASFQPKFPPRQNYQVTDLLAFYDEPFVRNAYAAILKREPDDSGFATYLENLRSGRVSRIDVLASLRFSPEGRSKDVKIEGLSKPAAFRKLYRLPVIGYLFELAVNLLRLPALVVDLRKLEGHSAHQQARLAEHLDETIENVEELTTELKIRLANRLVQAEKDSEANRKVADLHYQQISALFREQRELTEEQNRIKTNISGQVDSTQNQLAEQELAREKLAIDLLTLKELVETTVTQSLQQTRMELVLQERRLTLFLEEARKRLPESFAVEQLKQFADEKDQLLDSLYSSLSDQLRGTRENIKDRLKAYLPILIEANAISDILDLGCGRGEWLEVLKQVGFSARGIDQNQLVVQQCLDLGLDAVRDEVLSYLRSVPDSSVACVTVFHLAEHLRLETLVDLLNEIARTLRPGGLVILETPNPENVLVGSCNFYLDPTHRNPIPSETMKFLLESRGFCRLHVLKLNAIVSKKIKGEDELTRRFNEY
ncbi:MAG: methyltransferase domain-containing protein, partial [Pyrinomonadaceae bacterium]